jgi:general secretion pathway protein D
LAQGRPPQITADEIHNALVVMTTPRTYQVIEAALTKLDVPPLQVLIEAVVAEVTLTTDLQYGVQWFLKTGNSAQFTLSNSATGSTAPIFPGFAAVLSKGKDITGTLSALQSITTVHVLSSPQLMVINNQTATLQVGNQVPIATQSAVSVVTTNAPVVNTIQYRDTGVILKVTPRVNASGHVQMDVVQEVSDVTNTTTSGIDSPTILQRKFNSAVSVESGDTIVLGGVIQDKRSLGNSGVPLLKDIPLLGNLFKTNTDTDNRTEVIVLITPQVVTNEVDIGRVTEEFRRRLNEMAGPQLP